MSNQDVKEQVVTAYEVGKALINHTAVSGDMSNTRTANAMLVLLMATETEIAEMVELTHTSFTFQVISKRLAQHSLKVDSAALVFLSMLAEGSPGNAVLLCALVKYLSKHYDYPEVTMLHIIHDAFPQAMPNEQVFKASWDMQKKGGANWLDTAEAWA